MANREDHPQPSEARPAAPPEASDRSSASKHRAVDQDQSSQDKLPGSQEGLARDRLTAVAPRPGEGATAEVKANRPPAHPRRKWFLLGAGVIVTAGAAYFIVPWVITALNTVSTDDAYVNGHVTFVAPRVAGQVTEVLVDDNYRVKKGDLLVQLDKEPYQVQVEIKKAAVVSAEADLAAAQAQVQRPGGPGPEPIASSSSMPSKTWITRSPICAPTWRRSTAGRRPWSWRRPISNGARSWRPAGASARKISTSAGRRSRSMRRQSSRPCRQSMRSRVGLGLPAEPPKGHDLTEVPADLDQNFSTVRQALADLLQSAAQFGYFPTSWNATPKQAIADFYKQDPKGNLDRIYAQIIPNAPAIKQAEAKLLQAKSDLDQAELNLRYCDVVSDIDGVVTRRNVNPGNNVQAGQSLMAVRSLTEIWIDANFKETQLGGPAHRPARALRGGHVRQPAGVRGPHHRLHDGDR